MALKRTGVMFKVKNPGKLVMTGKLQVTKEMMKRWLTYEEKSYKDNKYHEVEIGMFKNEKGDMQYFPLMEFLPEGNEGSNEPGNGGDDDEGLPF